MANFTELLVGWLNPSNELTAKMYAAKYVSSLHLLYMITQYTRNELDLFLTCCVLRALDHVYVYE